ncbi:hypothetical protein ACHAXS_006009 [Conticribra weissflogii]
MEDLERNEDYDGHETPVTSENSSGRSDYGRANQGQMLAGKKRRRSLLTSSVNGNDGGGGGTGEDDAMSSSSSDRPQSTSDSREEGLSSNNSSEENEHNFPIAHLRSSSKKKLSKSASTSTKSATTTSSSSNSLREGEFADPIGCFFDGGAAEETAKKSSRLGGMLSGRGAASDFTSEDVSSSDSAGKQHHSSDSKGCSDDKESSTASEKPSYFKQGSSREEISIGSDFNFGQPGSQLDAPSASKESDNRRFSCNTSSCSDIDAIIRRAQNAGKSSASSSSSDDFADQTCKSTNGIGNCLFDRTRAGIHEHRGFIDRKTAAHQSSENDSGSSNRSAVSSKGGSKDTSLGGSFSTSILDGIASVDNIGDGALSSSCSGGDNLNKLSESGGSSSDSDNVSTKESQDKESQRFEPMESDVAAASFPQVPLPQVSVTPTLTTPGNAPQLGTILNQAFLVPPARPRQVLPIYLDFFLMKRIEATLIKSQESHQRLRDWDAMMGLGSSHSITMTRSARSRKKLHNFTKKWLKKIGDGGIT